MLSPLSRSSRRSWVAAVAGLAGGCGDTYVGFLGESCGTATAVFWSSGHFLLFLTGPGACVVPTLGWFVIISDLHVWGPAVADWRAVEIQIPRVKLQLLSPYAHPSALKQRAALPNRANCLPSQTTWLFYTLWVCTCLSRYVLATDVYRSCQHTAACDGGLFPFLK